ncbi:MAG: hypothetical protein QXT34_01805 [Candidatus Aenigmatarchaeota archaeon]
MKFLKIIPKEEIIKSTSKKIKETSPISLEVILYSKIFLALV